MQRSLQNMTDTIQQIQASFNPVEDRLLLKLHTGGLKLEAWITRRYLKLLIPALQGIHPKTGQPIFSHKKQALVEMSQQTSLKESQLNIPYQEPVQATSPLGDEPILLVKMSFKDLEGDSPALILEPEKGLGLVLSFQPELVKALSNILNKAIQTSDWDLEINPIMNLPENMTLQ